MKHSVEQPEQSTDSRLKRTGKRASALLLASGAALVLPLSVANAESSPKPTETTTTSASPSPEASPSTPPLSSDDDSHMVLKPEAAPSLPPLSSDNDGQMVNRPANPASPELPKTGVGFPVEAAALLGGALIAAGAAAQVSGTRKQQ